MSNALDRMLRIVPDNSIPGQLPEGAYKNFMKNFCYYVPMMFSSEERDKNGRVILERCPVAVVNEDFYETCGMECGNWRPCMKEWFSDGKCHVAIGERHPFYAEACLVDVRNKEKEIVQ